MKYLKGFLILTLCSMFGCGWGNASSLIVPRQGIGPFRLGMTKADTGKLVKPEAYAEGEQDGQATVSLDDLDSTRRIGMVLNHEGKVISISIHGDRSAWHGAQGISLGTTLSRLAALNGQPIRLHAYDMSEKSGTVLNWGRRTSGRGMGYDEDYFRLAHARPEPMGRNHRDQPS